MLAAVLDLSDLGIAFGSAVGEALYNPITDANGSGTVDVSDLNSFGTHFGHVLPAGTPVNNLFRRAALAAQVDTLFATVGDSDDDDGDDLLAEVIEDVVIGSRRKRTRLA